MPGFRGLWPMGNISYLNISNEASIVIVGGDRAKNLLLRNKLQDLGFKNFAEFERGADFLRTVNTVTIDLIYVVETPRDMNWMTFVRTVRTGQAFSAVPLVLTAAPNMRFSGEEKGLIRAYHVHLVQGRLNDDKLVSSSLQAIFANKADTGSFQARLSEAKELLRKGLTTKAAEVYRELLQESDESITARYGLMLAASQDREAYWQQLQRLLAQDPKNYHFRFEMVERAFRENQVDKAKDLLEGLLDEIALASELYWLNELGVICVGMRFYAFSLKIAEVMRGKASPLTLWQPDLLVSRTYLASGRSNEAQKFLDKAKRVAQGRHAEIENLGAVIARRSGDYQAAIRLYLAALELSPEDHRLAFNLALCYMHLEDMPNAMKYCRRSHNACPSYERAKNLLDTLVLKSARESEP